MSEIIEEYDNNKNLVYYKSIIGEYWKEYDENNNLIYFKNIEKSNTYEGWIFYDENDNEIHCKSSDDFEAWYKWENNRKIEITQQEFKQIERTKLYLNNKKINRFEIMDI